MRPTRDRAWFKQTGKNMFLSNYWPFIGVCVLLAVFVLSACGTQTKTPEETAVPMEEDSAPQYDPSDPLASQLDRSNLDEETISNATQSLDVTCEDNGVIGKLQQAMGSANLLYLSLEVTYPDTAEHLGLLDSSPVFTLTKTGQAMQEDSFASVGSSWGCDPDNTSITYLLEAESSHALLTTGQDVTLRMEIPATGSALSFDWTIETSAPQKEIVLKNEQGEQMGSAILTPFALSAFLDSTSQDRDGLLSSLVLLDKNGDLLTPNEAAAAADAETYQLFFEFFSPLMVEQVGTVQIGALTGTVS